MSSIHEALQADINRGRPHKSNQVVLRSHQEAADGPIGGDFFARKEMEHKQERERRRAEGGKHGGFFDRQLVVPRRDKGDSDEEIDDFGRKRKKQAGTNLSKSARAQAALQRLRGGGAGGSSPTASGSNGQDRRSRSRSGGRDRFDDIRR
mmetsp:Transcript_12123/g.34739  ORF Transcript_12123/g.34739 Transcript_12123/m.34739 type:complete len:150 (-) Transcript_12123:53-502(-)